MSIKEFFKNQEIFITGGSGFLGKALIEKILRSCPDFSKIYVLLRPKRNKSAEQRLQDLLGHCFFDRAREEQPAAFKKVEAIGGDCNELKLAIEEEDLLKLRNVTIIFHSAASVRFDDPLRRAILLNIRGTHEVLKIAETLKKLKVFAHISTTYCYPEYSVIEEKVHKQDVKWRDSIRIAEALDEELLEIFCKRYTDFKPNTYTFTKALAEQMVQEYKDKLPVIIYRPSVIVGCLDDPVPGWVDNFNGPIGLLIGSGIGILRTGSSSKAIIALVPIDIVVRGLIIATYKKGIEPESDLEVYNCAINKLSPIRLREFVETCKRLVLLNPFERTLWVPGGTYTDCPFYYYPRFFALQVLPALFVDTLLRLKGGKPMLLKIQRRVHSSLAAVRLFANTDWDFKVERFFSLEGFVPKDEYNDFAFKQKSYLDYDKYVADGVRGSKKFLLNENPEASPLARRRLKILKVINYIVHSLWYIFILRFIFYFVKDLFK